jgi:hypothetical protein
MLSVGGLAFIGLCYLRIVMREGIVNKFRVTSSLIRAEFIDILQSSKRQTFRYFHYSRVRYITHQPSVFEVYILSLVLEPSSARMKTAPSFIHRFRIDAFCEVFVCVHNEYS